LYSASVTFICLWSIARYKSKSRGVLIGILKVANLHLQWKIVVSTTPFSHYIQLFTMFMFIL
jgi:hypothetical protein